MVCNNVTRVANFAKRQFLKYIKKTRMRLEIQHKQAKKAVGGGGP
jgi:hypothetical protein